MEKKQMNKYFNTPSPGFSSFRSLMDQWDKHCVLEEQEKNINDILDRHGMILFFKKNDSFFGAPEESRIMFARLKNNQEDPTEDARFTGIDLLKSMFGNEGDSVQSTFGSADLPDIQVCDRDEIIKHLMNQKPPKKEKK